MFDAKGTKREIVAWIRDFFQKNGGWMAVVGISGGKDSTVAAALCVEALGKDSVLGVLMPNGVQQDISDSYKVVDFLGIDHCEVNIREAYQDIIDNLKFANIDPSEQTKINLPARLRMTTLYAVSQSVGGRVVNTCNLSEDWIGYSTRYGDSVGDFSPLSMLLTDEVIAIGRECGIPEELLTKTPSDGLCGKTDEDSLGFTYAALNDYIRTGTCPAGPVISDKINFMHVKNLFKMYTMPHYTPSAYVGVERKLHYPDDIPMIIGE